MVQRIVIAVALMMTGILAYANTLDPVIERLKSGDAKVVRESIQLLVDKNDFATYPLLKAMNDKKLYLHEDELVTIVESRESGTKGAYFVYRLYPKYEMWNLEADQPFLVKSRGELDELKVARTARLLLLPVLPYVNLADTDIDKRTLAYTQFQANGTPDALNVLEVAKSKESNEAIVRLAKETILTIKLKFSKDKSEQIQLIDAITTNLGDNTLPILNDILDREGQDNEVVLKLQDAIAHVEARARRIGVFQNLFSGLSLGSILIMVALGLSIIYGLAGVINMAHGEFMMIGAYTTFSIQELFKSLSPSGQIEGDLFFWVSLPLSFFVCGAFGLVVERLVLRKLYGRPLESLLATWGISLVLIQLARSVFGDLTAVKTPEFLSGGWHVVPQLVLPFNRIFIISLTLILISSAFLFLYRTKNGLRIRAVTQNRNMSACLGISTARIDALTFFVGTGIAGVAGCAMTLIGNVVPDMGQTYIVDSFLVVVTGGVGNLFGTIFAGLGIGQITKVLEPIFHAVYGKVIILMIIIFFLQFKPRGLFPVKGRIVED